MYLLMAVDNEGRVRCGFTTNNKVPDNWTKPGEIAFTLKPEDWKASHTHEYQIRDPHHNRIH